MTTPTEADYAKAHELVVCLCAGPIKRGSTETIAQALADARAEGEESREPLVRSLEELARRHLASWAKAEEELSSLRRVIEAVRPHIADDAAFEAVGAALNRLLPK